MTKNIGKMTERITIETPANTPDGMGGYTTTYPDTYSCWAQVFDGSSTFFKGDTERGSASDMTNFITQKIFRVRYNSTLMAIPTTDLRILYMGRRYKITSKFEEKIRDIIRMETSANNFEVAT